MRIALFQPDIPQNTGAIMRLCACFNVGLDIIEPCGFPFSDAKMKRAGMDYIDLVQYRRHNSWNDFVQNTSARLILVETDGQMAYQHFSFKADDVLILGRESAGTPRDIYSQVAASVHIPQAQGRSLNVGMAAAIVLAESLRQTGQLF